MLHAALCICATDVPNTDLTMTVGLDHGFDVGRCGREPALADGGVGDFQLWHHSDGKLRRELGAAEYLLRYVWN